MLEIYEASTKRILCTSLLTTQAHVVVEMLLDGRQSHIEHVQQDIFRLAMS